MGEIPQNIKIDFMLADIYSLGLILLNCCGIPMNVTQNLSGHCLKEKKHDNEVEEVIEEIKEKGVYSDKIIGAIKTMLSFDPEKRRTYSGKLFSEEKNLNIQMVKEVIKI